MKSFDRVYAEPYFKMREIAVIVRDRDFAAIDALFEQEVKRVCDIIDNLDTPEDERDFFAQPPKDKALIDNLTTLCELLDQLKKQCLLLHLMYHDQIYSWDPPRDHKGNILWRQEVQRPLIMPMENPLPKPTESTQELKTDPDLLSQPDGPFLYRKKQHTSIPNKISVKDLYDMRYGTMSDLEKRTLNDNLGVLETLYSSCAAALDTKLSKIPQLLAFFDKPAVKKARSNLSIELN